MGYADCRRGQQREGTPKRRDELRPLSDLHQGLGTAFPHAIECTLPRHNSLLHKAAPRAAYRCRTGARAHSAVEGAGCVVLLAVEAAASGARLALCFVTHGSTLTTDRQAALVLVRFLVSHQQTRVAVAVAGALCSMLCALRAGPGWLGLASRA
eukprot:scaffold12213_cov115-Isochrysis_galbana.AAC.10